METQQSNKCKFCDPDIFGTYLIAKEIRPYITLQLENSFGYVRIIAAGDNNADYAPKFCPECGRELTD